MQNETGELIIRFKRGVDEEAATSVVTDLGGTVRRRMRTDDPGDVMLLVRMGGDLQQAAQKATRHPQVEMVEVNQGGFTLR